jgi:hypothetical protein
MRVLRSRPDHIPLSGGILWKSNGVRLFLAGNDYDIPCPK